MLNYQQERKEKKKKKVFYPTTKKQTPITIFFEKTFQEAFFFLDGRLVEVVSTGVDGLDSFLSTF